MATYQNKWIVSYITRKGEVYNEFLTAAGATELSKSPLTPIDELPKGSIVKVKSTKEEYLAFTTVADAQQPSRTENVKTLPPAILGVKAEDHHWSPLLEKIAELRIYGPKGKPDHHSIAYDNSSGTTLYTGVASYSWSHACGATANLLVFFDGHASLPDVTVSNVTYNSVALTPIRTDVYLRNDAYPAYYRTTMSFLYAPTTGSAKTVAVTLSGTMGGTQDFGYGSVTSISGAKQSSQPDAQAGNNGGGGSPVSAPVTTIANNCWVFSVFIDDEGAPTPSQTLRISGALRFGTSDTNGPVTPPGLQNMTWTQVSTYFALSAASFSPSPSSLSGGGNAAKLFALGAL
jgi:hypothetical protein